MGAPVVLGVLLAGIALVSATCTNRCLFTATSTHTTHSAVVRKQVVECARGCCQLATCTHVYYGATDGVCTTVTNHATQIARNSDIVYRKDGSSSRATTPGNPVAPGALMAPETPGTPAAPTSTSCYNTSVAYTGTHANTFGTPCMLWMEINEPHYTDDDFPSDGSVFGAANYCRAPRANTNDPFCYTQGKTAGQTDMWFCDVPSC